jgi:4-methyl-5(b-hydroxyethyl)-thiazole monophosphate biosynthesis
MARALVILAEGFEEIEAITIVDVLRRGGVAVTTAALSGKHPRGSHDIAVEADVTLSGPRISDYDALVLPGGPGSQHLREDPHVQALIKEAAGAGKIVAAICAAPTALEAAGVLHGKRATCYPGSSIPSAEFVDAPVVEDGNIITSRGPATAMAFALKLVERLESKGTADSTAEKMLFARRLV